MQQTIEITGSYKGSTGHDHHTRSIVRALHECGVKIKLNDLPEWSPAKLPAPLQDPWFEELRQPVAAKIHLFFCMPHQVRCGDRASVVNYTMFEADRIPELWVRESRQHELIIVPANSCRQAWIDSGVPEEKLAVCPLGVDSDLFHPGVAPLSLSTPSGCRTSQFRVRFLNVSDYTDRKNLIGLLRVWLATTEADDDTVLILKPGLYSPGARERLQQKMCELESAVGKPFIRAAPIVFVDGILSPAAMPGLYTAATHYISASRGEGFDLPMLEAAVSGLELIAPRHSAYLDYLHDGIAHLVAARPAEARLLDDPDTHAFYAGARWWEPDQDALCTKLREIVDGSEEKKDSSRAELSRLSWSRTADHLRQIIFTRLR